MTARMHLIELMPCPVCGSKYIGIDYDSRSWACLCGWRMMIAEDIWEELTAVEGDEE